MNYIYMISGKYCGEIWNFKNDQFMTCINCIEKREIHISNVVDILCHEVLGDKVKVEISFSDNTSFVASMDKRSYDLCLASYRKHHVLNDEATKLDEVNKFLYQNEMKGGGVSVDGNIKSWLIYFSIIIFVLIAISLGGESNKEFTTPEKVKLCKAYVGALFSKPVRLIDNYRNEDGLIYVRYNRASDNTRWNYVCNISSQKMVWASWINSDQKWGRWRFEDEVSPKYHKDSNSVSFIMKDTQKKVIVEL
ncbi:hypothetical protein P0F02_003240 [Vibrio metschnikovii]|nr:hypothetical protein [Vibrio metschnikovii]EKO3695102.1 hypothetical protein [Vibrio metschnikovii]